MIVGVGIDVVDIARFQERMERNPRLGQRLFARPDPDATLRKMSPGAGEVSRQIERQLPRAMGAMAGMSGALAGMIPQLREAADAQEPVWVAYMDQAGTRTERVVEPLRVDAGWLTAFDHRTQRVQRFAVHRIVQVASAP